MPPAHPPSALPDGSLVSQHLGRDVTVVLLGSPPVAAGALVDAAITDGRAIKVVRVPHAEALGEWGARVVVLASGGEVAWSGDELPEPVTAVVQSVPRP